MQEKNDHKCCNQRNSPYTPRHIAQAKRKKNDVVLLPIGCTENHGVHNPTGLDTFMCTQICEAVRRKTAKMDIGEVTLAQLPAIVMEIEWHRAIREFFIPIDEPDSLTTHFIHADEAETCVANFLFGDMVDISVCVDAQAKSLALMGHYDTSTDTYGRAHTWSEGEGHNMIERYGTPEGVVGYPSRGDAFKAKRPIAAICELLTLTVQEMLEKYPAGTAPVEGFTTRPKEELEGCFKEPLYEGWVSVHELPKRGIFNATI